MKIALWTLLLMGLFVPGRTDCQSDCMLCDRILNEVQGFETKVCLVECYNKGFLGLTWGMCQTAMEEGSITSMSTENSMLKRAEEKVETVLPVGSVNEDLVYPGTMHRFDHVAQHLGLEEVDQESQVTQVNADYRFKTSQSVQEDKKEPDGNYELKNNQEDAPVNLTKRFGGFLKNKYGYRKLMNPGRSFQKRFGGFLGIRKSARKWNSQKRFSEILKQYLGMTTRASEFNSVSAGIAQPNEM